MLATYKRCCACLVGIWNQNSITVIYEKCCSYLSKSIFILPYLASRRVSPFFRQVSAYIFVSSSYSSNTLDLENVVDVSFVDLAPNICLVRDRLMHRGYLDVEGNEVSLEGLYPRTNEAKTKMQLNWKVGPFNQLVLYFPLSDRY